MNHVAEAVKEVKEMGDQLSQDRAKEGQEKLWKVLKELQDIASRENLTSVEANSEAAPLFIELWQILSESAKPKTSTLETQPYRVDTHIDPDSEGHIIAKVHARDNKHPPLFFDDSDNEIE